MIEPVLKFRVYCDECGRVLVSDRFMISSADRMEAESEARKWGWHVDGWRTVCPECRRATE